MALQGKCKGVSLVAVEFFFLIYQTLISRGPFMTKDLKRSKVRPEEVIEGNAMLSLPTHYLMQCYWEPTPFHSNGELLQGWT